MRYLARQLYFNSRNFLSMHVVETRGGEVVKVYPFDVEQQSMIFVEALMLSKNAETIEPVCNDDESFFPDNLPIPCYAIEAGE